MELVILGSGTGAFHPRRSACSALLEVDGQLLLIDCGPGVLLRLKEEGFDPQTLDAILITHFHPDHTLDLWAYFFAARSPSFRRPTGSPLGLITSQAITRLMADMETAYGCCVAPPPDLLARSLLDQAVAHGPFTPPPLTGLTVSTAPINHRPESTAFRIEANGKSVVFSGDADWSESLIDLAAGADWLVCEAALPEGRKIDGHLTPSLAGRIAARAGVGGLILTHLYPEHGDVDPLPPARSEFPGRILVAEDGLRLGI